MISAPGNLPVACRLRLGSKGFSCSPNDLVHWCSRSMQTWPVNVDSKHAAQNCPDKSIKCT